MWSLIEHSASLEMCIRDRGINLLFAFSLTYKSISSIETL